MWYNIPHPRDEAPTEGRGEERGCFNGEGLQQNQGWAPKAKHVERERGSGVVRRLWQDGDVNRREIRVGWVEESGIRGYGSGVAGGYKLVNWI